MKNQTCILKISVLLLTTLFFYSCDPEYTNQKNYSSGIFITNEGSFGSSNGSISFISRTDFSLENNIYANSNNGAVLGDVVQSKNVYNNKVYIVVNNSNKVQVVNLNDYSISGSIENRSLPRFIEFYQDKAYLTEWVSFSGNGRVSVINLTDLSIEQEISVGVAPEKMLIDNGKLYVVNSNDNTMTVIDVNTNTIIQNITVGDWPNSIVKDVNGYIWVLCGGMPDWTGTPTVGKLIKFNPLNQQIESTIDFTNTSSNPNLLSIDGSKSVLYYSWGQAIYKMEIEETQLPVNPLIQTNAYGLGIDPQSGNVFVADAGNFVANGMVRWYNGSTGIIIDSASVGIAPNGFYFSE